MYTGDELLTAAQAGDPDAFQEIIAPHVDVVRRLCRSFARNWSDADDLAQEALVKVFRSLHSYRGESSFSTWLYRVTRNSCIDWYRSKMARAREQEGNDFVDVPEESQRGQQQLLERQERIDLLRGAIGQLDPKYRVVLVLFDLEGLSYEEVAEIEQVPIGTVRSRLSRARAQLSEILLQNSDGSSN